MALLDDPALLDKILRELRVKGPLSPFTISELAVPVFDIGRLSAIVAQEVVTPDLASMVAAGHSAVARHYGAATPDQTALNVSSNDTNPAAAAVLADTGQLAAGQHFVAGFASTDAVAATRLLLRHRNAADAADIGLTWQFHMIVGQPAFFAGTLTMALNERVKWETVPAIVGTISTNIMATPSTLDVAV